MLMTGENSKFAEWNGDQLAELAYESVSSRDISCIRVEINQLHACNTANSR